MERSRVPRGVASNKSLLRISVLKTNAAAPSRNSTSGSCSSCPIWRGAPRPSPFARVTRDVRVSSSNTLRCTRATRGVFYLSVTSYRTAPDTAEARPHRGAAALAGRMYQAAFASRRAGTIGATALGGSACRTGSPVCRLSSIASGRSGLEARGAWRRPTLAGLVTLKSGRSASSNHLDIVSPTNGRSGQSTTIPHRPPAKPGTVFALPSLFDAARISILAFLRSILATVGFLSALQKFFGVANAALAGLPVRRPGLRSFHEEEV